MLPTRSARAPNDSSVKGAGRDTNGLALGSKRAARVLKLGLPDPDFYHERSASASSLYANLRTTI